MTHPADLIYTSLAEVKAERERRKNDQQLAAAVAALKAYQSQRFRMTYSDLLASTRYGAASRFFLEELYGPRDFTLRDEEFVRIVPGLVRLFPGEIIDTVVALAKLHALSESLDSAMGGSPGLPLALSPHAYIRAWQDTGRSGDRERQIVLSLEVGTDLDRFTRRPLLRQSLKLMRKPAQLAGLARLQQFLEAGFDAFAAMAGATGFLDTIAERERRLASGLFTGDPNDQDAFQLEPLSWLPRAAQNQ